MIQMKNTNIKEQVADSNGAQTEKCNFFLSKTNDTSGLCKFCNKHQKNHTRR